MISRVRYLIIKNYIQKQLLLSSFFARISRQFLWLNLITPCPRNEYVNNKDYTSKPNSNTGIPSESLTNIITKMISKQLPQNLIFVKTIPISFVWCRPPSIKTIDICHPPSPLLVSYFERVDCQRWLIKFLAFLRIQRAEKTDSKS